MTDLSAFATYLITERGLLPLSVRIYVREAERFTEFLAGRPITEALIREHCTALGGSASTFTRRLSAIKALCRWLGVGDLTVNIDRPKRHAGIPKPVENLEGLLPKLVPGAALAAVFLVETGMRVSEAYSVNAFPAPEELLVTGKGQKDRFVPLTPRARAALNALGGSLPFSPRWLQAQFRTVGFNPHRLRHTFATQAIADGEDLGDVQHWLGHSSPATTLIYAAWNRQRLRDMAARKAKRARPEATQWAEDAAIALAAEVG